MAKMSRERRESKGFDLFPFPHCALTEYIKKTPTTIPKATIAMTSEEETY